MKVFHLFIGKSSDGLWGLDNWCATNPFLLGALGRKNDGVWSCKILLSFSATAQCYHVETWWGSPYGHSPATHGHYMWREIAFHLAPQESYGKKCGDLRSPWGRRMSWVGKPARGFLRWVRTVSATVCRSSVLHGSQQQCRTGVLQWMHPILYGKWIFCPLRHYILKQQIVRLLHLIVRLEYLIYIVQ